MATQVCIECNIKKPLKEAFYTHPRMANGHVGVCKECHKARMRRRRRLNPCVQEYDRERSKTPERKELARKNTSRWRAENPEKYRAHSAVNNALRDGKLLRPTLCQECKEEKRLHAHHDDYEKILEVRWLCAPCHQRHHADSEKLS